MIIKLNDTTVNNQKEEDTQSLWVAVTSYATVTAYYWILSMVGGEFGNNIYAKQGKFMDKNVSNSFNNKVYYVNQI